MFFLTFGGNVMVVIFDGVKELKAYTKFSFKLQNVDGLMFYFE